MDPQQEMFIAIREAAVSLFGEGHVYDGRLPPEGTPYPFVYLAANTWTDDTGNKSVIRGRNHQTIHVWHNNVRERGTVSDMLYRLKIAIMNIRHTDRYGWMYRTSTQQILEDNTTKQPLLHGVLEAEHELLGG